MYSVFFAYDMQPMDKMDDIVDIAITEESVIVYNSKYWRAFDMNGQVSIPSQGYIYSYGILITNGY